MNIKETHQPREIILTGDRATGPLHLGHYVGSLQQRVALQSEHDQTILVADMQGLTDNAHNPSKVSSNILNVVTDYLAVGIDPHSNHYLFAISAASPRRIDDVLQQLSFNCSLRA
ncbi:hypothetical protein ACMVZV_002511 [Vibrio parahaemolyticus]